MQKFSGKPQFYDYEARSTLHSYLFSHVNSRGVAKVNKKILAEEIGCSQQTVGRLLRDLVLLEKIERVAGPGTLAHFYVTEPEQKIGQEIKKKERVVMWG